MWLILAREPKSDKPYWRGRGWFAVVDALVWPISLAVAVSLLEVSIGIVSPVVIALAILSAIRRMHRAVCMNHRYRFTTWRWGRVLAVLWTFGWLLKLLIPR